MRRAIEYRLHGYTLEASREVRDAVFAAITDSGYAIVPVEPSEATVSRGWYEALKDDPDRRFCSDDLFTAYRAMIAGACK